MKRKRRAKHFIKNTFIGGLIFVCVAGGLSFLWLSSFKIPNLETFESRKIAQSTRLYDRTGQILLYEINDKAKRTLVPSDQISKNIKNAAVAIEDAEFYQHNGVKISSFLRAVFANLTTGKFSQGGSTITQQVVKNSLLTSEKTISRKIKEWILALRLEKIYDKETILAYYLNDAPYGGNIYGIERASEMFFGKKASEVTLAEAAYLAAIPNAPTYYSPYGTHRDKLEDRKNLVLKRMVENNFITEKESTQALAEKVEFKPTDEESLKAPHFVIFVKEYLEKKYGEAAVREGGLKVITTLDYTLEKKAEEIAKRYALQNEKNFNAENASVVAIDPTTGQILVMVGSRDYFDKKIDGNFNIALAKRQPGSSFKPFVYATAFKKGYLPETKVFDLLTEFSTACNPDGTPIIPGHEDECYMPVNYDGKFLGPISLRDALAQSRNIPAIKTLYLAGMKDSLQTAQSLGISSLTNVNRYGLTLVLGGGEVSLLEMTSSYGVFANEGVRNDYTALLEVDDANGNVLEKYEPHSYPVLDRQVALTISDILSDNVARTPEFGADSALYFPSYNVAVKTGTTNNYRDAWILGYTPHFVAGAWAGNNDNTPMEKKIAGFIIAPLWHEFMAEALTALPKETFTPPDPVDHSKIKPAIRGFWEGNKVYTVDKVTGKLATESTPVEMREDRVVKNIHSILYWVDRNNPLGDPPLSPDSDSQFKLWEYPIRKWVAEQHITEEADTVIPTGTDDVHTQNGAPKIKITNPKEGVSYPSSAKIAVSIESTGNFPLARIDVFINNSYVGTSASAHPSFSFVPSTERAVTASNTLRVVGYDSVGNSGEATSHFTVSF